MYDIKITALKKADHTDLQALYENPIEEACCVEVGETWTSHGGTRPEDFCPEAWKSMREFVEALSRGEGNFFGSWMKDPHSAMISCNDGFRPVSFLIERIPLDETDKPDSDG